MGVERDFGAGRFDPVVKGWCARGYEGVRDAFVANLRVGDDYGAAVAVYRHGRCVVDLWGGVANRDDPLPYPEDALEVLFSTSKGLVALCLASLVESGEMKLDEPVAAYWPEFAQGGKEAVTVRELASHQAGLPAFENTVTLAELTDWAGCVVGLAAQEPAWPPGSAHGYHALTIGYLLGEVIRRAGGMSVGALLGDRFSGPLGLESWIGLPSALSSRVVRLVEVTPHSEEGAVLVRAEADPATLTGKVFSNPAINVDNFDQPLAFSAEIPAVCGVSDARSLAKIYASVVDGPLRQIGDEVVRSMTRSLVWGPDLVLIDQPTRFGTGFMLSAPREPMLGPGSFGHNGRGGSLAFAHPESGISYGFVANRMVLGPGPDRRSTRLLAAVRDAIG